MYTMNTYDPKKHTNKHDKNYKKAIIFSSLSVNQRVELPV